MTANEIVKNFNRYMFDPVIKDNILSLYEEDSTMYVFLQAMEYNSAKEILEHLEHHLYLDCNLDKVNLDVKKCYDIHFTNDPDQSLWDNYVITMSSAA